MKLYVISVVTGGKFAGPTYSVPRTVKELADRADVVWLNVESDYVPDALPEKVVYYSAGDYKKKGLDAIIAEAGKPDFVLFQEFYCIEYCKLSRRFTECGIPYTITPRGSLCADAQAKKKLKKTVANLLFFNRFAKSAAGIQYLTDKEAGDSGKKWNKNQFVIPNGIDIPEENSVMYDKPENVKFKGLFIGRYDIFHKGLDILAEALSALKKDRKLPEGFTVDLFGPDSVGDEQNLRSLISEKALDGVISVNRPVYDDEKSGKFKDYGFFVLTSRFEGHPMGLLEALAHGLPALVTYGCNMGNEIIDAGAGWVADIDSESLSEKIIQMINDGEKFAQYSENAVKLAQKYKWENIADQIIQMVGQLK